MMRRTLSLLSVLLLTAGVFLIVQRAISLRNGGENGSVRLVVLKADEPDDILPVRCEGALPVTYSRVPDLSGLGPSERKRKFIDLVLPSVLIANFEVVKIKKRVAEIIKKIETGESLSKWEKKFLERIMRRCRADSPREILIKANPVPPSLVIAQSAIETGWGTSRFFLEGNNLFGMWTFREEKNSLHARRASAKLRTYETILDSVRDYLYNLNVGWAYEEFRMGRMRSFNPYLLSEYMSFYSIERGEYVKKIRDVIAQNDLTRFDRCFIDPDFIR
jgi:Bax protein